MRTINNLFCVFDMSICRTLKLTHPISTRAIFTYDRDKDKKEIQILNKELNLEIHQRLLAWMYQNLQADYIIDHLKGAEIDTDPLAAANS